MTITRILPGVVLAAITTAGSALGQYGLPPYSPPGRSAAMVPSVLPAGGSESEAQPAYPPPATSLGQMTSPTPPVAGAGGPNPLATLTAPPGPQGLPPGSYASPWYGDAPGCCGPVGRHGPVAYELYARTGPDLPFGSGAFTGRIINGKAVVRVLAHRTF